jgi:predicted transcriptional regulator
MSAMLQRDRVLRWLRENPGSSMLEVQRALGCTNATARISELRDAGHMFRKERVDGVYRYSLVEPRVDRGETVGMGLA